MIRLVTPSRFTYALSESPRLKFILTGLSVVFLVFPSGVLMSLGFAPKYVLSGMAVSIVPFQYLAFCILESRRGGAVAEAGGPSLSESGDLRILIPRLVPYPGPMERFTLRFAAVRALFPSGNGRRRAQPEISSPAEETFSDESRVIQLRPTSQVCYTRV
jgi:hypothetical protein